MKMRYFRHSDAQLGFILREEMRIESNEKLKFNAEI
jgi:hypothetical protein